MTTYTIVDKDTDPLGPNEIAAGSNIEVSNGDIFIVASSANASITFQAAGGVPADFELRFEDSNPNSINVKIDADLAPTVTIDSNADLSNVNIDAKATDGLNLTAGDDISFGKLKGSTNDVNTITIGARFSTDQDWKLGDANDSLSVGDDATFKTSMPALATIRSPLATGPIFTISTPSRAMTCFRSATISWLTISRAATATMRFTSVSTPRSKRSMAAVTPTSSTPRPTG